MLDQITPLLLTYNEASNIGRTLGQLRWARDIVVVDSFSQDETVDIVSDFAQARVFPRAFDNHQNQWNFGLKETAICTEWVLALDADYVLTDDFVNEMKRLNPRSDTRAYEAGFTYCINGKPLRSGIYPPVTVLYRRDSASYMLDGHTQKLANAGPVEKLYSRILHDDRKPLSRWFSSQVRYTQLEAKKLLSAEPGSLGWTDRIRQLRVVAPVAMLSYCLIVRGGILDGSAGFYYAFQRMLAELILSLCLIEHDLRVNPDARSTTNLAERGSKLVDANEERHR